MPATELHRFNGDPSNWPDFIENFKRRVHSKSTFSDDMRMERLISVLDGEAKRTVQAIGQNGIFYASAMKALKRDFGNPIVVSHAKLKAIFDQPQITNNNKISLRSYQQQLKSIVTWLKTMGYITALKSIDNVIKAVKHLPNHLRNSFYKDFRTLSSGPTKINLETFMQWLDEKPTEYFNPIATIINQEKRDYHKLHLKRLKKVFPSNQMPEQIY